MGILEQHFQKFANEELQRQIIMRALLEDYEKKLDQVDIVKAIETQFPMDDLDEMLANGMSIQDVYDYLDEENGKLKEILLALDVAFTNLADITMEVKERFGGNYNDQT